MLVYATHTGTRDITERMDQFLSQHGFKVAVLKADTVAPDRRESWVDERVKQGVDVLVCHPRLVQTGLDLVGLPYNLLVRDRLFGIHHAPGFPPLLAHRPDQAGQGGVIAYRAPSRPTP